MKKEKETKKEKKKWTKPVLITLNIAQTFCDNGSGFPPGGPACPPTSQNPFCP